MKSHCFKFYRAYSSSFNSSNVCNFCWSWILKDCIKERKSLSCVQVSTKREIRHFHVVVVQWQQRNVPKSVMHVQGFCFANLNLLLFAVLVEVVVVVASATGKRMQHCWPTTPNIAGCYMLRPFAHWAPRTANVKKSRDQGLAVRFAVWGSRLYG